MGAALLLITHDLGIVAAMAHDGSLGFCPLFLASRS
jgi:hypothetical protein